MKKLLTKILAAVMALGMLTGCTGKTNVVGTWYSDYDLKALMLKEDNTYTGSGWLSKGDYSIEDDKVILVGEYDGTTVFKIEKEDGETILRNYKSSGEIHRTYYKSEEQAQKAKEKREEEERIAKEKKAAEELEALKKDIVGCWCSDYEPVEFTKDGQYLEYTADGIKKGKYEVISGSEIVYTMDDGEEYTGSADIGEDGTAHFGMLSYEKAEHLDLSEELLLGQWYDASGYIDDPVREFYDNGTYAIKSLIVGLDVEDTIVKYSIVNENQFYSENSDFPDGMTRYGYLFKTDTEYYLYWSNTSVMLGDTYTKLGCYVKPISDK